MYFKQFTSKYSSAFGYFPVDPSIAQNKGEVYCLVSVQMQSRYSPERMMKFVWDALIEDYIYSQLGPLESLKSAIKACEKKLRNLIRNDPELDGSGVNLNLTVVAARDANIYVANIGDNQIGILRGGRYIDIAEILRKHNVYAGSAMVGMYDVITITAGRVFEKIEQSNFDARTITEVGEHLPDDSGILLISHSELPQYEKSIIDNSTPSEDDVFNEVLIEEQREDNLDAYEIAENPRKDIDDVEEQEIDPSLADNGDLENGFTDERISVERSTVSTVTDLDQDGIPEVTTIRNTSVTRDSFEHKGSESIEDDGTEYRSEENVEESAIEGDFDSNPVERFQGLPSREELLQKRNSGFDNNADSDMSKGEYATEEYALDNGDAEVISSGEYPTSISSMSQKVYPTLDNSAETQNLPDFSEIVNKEPKGLAKVFLSIKLFLVGIKNKVRDFLTKSKIGSIIWKVFRWIIRFFINIAEKLGSLISAILRKIRNLMDDKLGRKIWYKKMMSKLSVSRMNIAGAPNIKGMRVDYYKVQNEKRRKIGFILLAVVGVILIIVGVQVTNRMKEENEVHERVLAYSKEIEGLITSAKVKQNDDIDSAVADITLSNNKLQSALAIVIWDSDKSSLSALKEQLEREEDNIYKRTPVGEKYSNFELYLDGKISLNDKAEPTDMFGFRDANQNEHLYITDKGGSAVYRVALYDKKIEKIADTSKLISSPMSVGVGTWSNDTYGVFVYDKQNGVLRSMLKGTTFSDFEKVSSLGPENLANKVITDIAVLTKNHNVYLLSQTDKAILKSTRVDDLSYGSFSLLSTLISKDVLANGVNIMADSNGIYFTYTGAGSIGKNAADSTMKIEGVFPELSQVTVGYTGVLVTEKMYLFDKEYKRIVVLEKPDNAKGLHPNKYVFVKQYTYRGDRQDVFTDVKGLAIDKGEQNLYVLDGSKIWRISQ